MRDVIVIDSSPAIPRDSEEEKKKGPSTPLFNAFRDKYLNSGVLMETLNKIEPTLFSDDLVVIENSELDNDLLLPVTVGSTDPLKKIKPPVTKVSKKSPKQKALLPIEGDLNLDDNSRRERMPKKRKPRVKAEALSEIKIIIDDRLYSQLNATEETLGTVPLLRERLWDENAVCWRNRDDESMYEHGALIMSAEAVYSRIKTGDIRDVSIFLDHIEENFVKGGIRNRYLVVAGGKILARKKAAELNKQFRKCVLTGKDLLTELTPSKKLPPWQVLEEKLWLESVERKIHVQFLERYDWTSVLTHHLLMMTRDVAWAPYCSKDRELTVLEGWKSKSGKDAKDTWKLMLEEIPKVTPSTAEILAAIYEIPRAMLEQDRDRVRRELEAVRLGERRTLGPTLARKICAIGWCAEGQADELVNSL